MDWLRSIFDSESFSPRGSCGDWGEWLPWVYQAANAATAAAYYMIPAWLAFMYVKQRGVIPKGWVVLLFVAFIALCGTAHVMSVLSFHWPAYRLFTLIDVATAAVSVATAACMPHYVRHVLKLPTQEEFARAKKKLEQEAEAREAMLRERAAHNERLRQAANEMREELDAVRWKLDVDGEYKKMREVLHKIRGA